MKTLKFNTKKAQNFIREFWNSNTTDLFQAYRTYSIKKIAGQYYCGMLYQQEKGYMFRIISWNTYHFTCAWLVDETDGTTSLRVETARYSYIIKRIELPF